MRIGCICVLAISCTSVAMDDTGFGTPTTDPAPDGVLPCPHPDAPYRFEGMQRPVFAPPATGDLTRTYSGRVSLPELTTTDLTSVWVQGVPASVDGVLVEGERRSVRFTALATCTECSALHIHLGGPAAPPILTAPTDPTGDVDRLVTLETTARMALALSTAEGGAARIEPATRSLRPDLNGVVSDMEQTLLEGLILGVGTGVTESAQPIPDSGQVAAADILLSDGTDGPGTTSASWVLPAAQPRAGDRLVLWSDQGRSEPMAPIDGLFLLDLPFEGPPVRYVARWLREDGSQSNHTRFDSPITRRTGELDVALEDALRVTSRPGAWVVTRSAEGPGVQCRIGADGSVVIPVADGPVELVVIDNQGPRILGSARCDPDAEIPCP